LRNGQGDRSTTKAVNRKIKGVDMDLEALFLVMENVLSGEPGFPRIIAAPVAGREDDKVIGCILTLNLNVKHDPKIAIHFKALIERLLELEIENESPETTQMMRDAIAACQTNENPSIKIL
jgi:hypothetical protein